MCISWACWLGLGTNFEKGNCLDSNYNIDFLTPPQMDSFAHAPIRTKCRDAYECICICIYIYIWLYALWSLTCSFVATLVTKAWTTEPHAHQMYKLYVSKERLQILDHCSFWCFENRVPPERKLCISFSNLWLSAPLTSFIGLCKTDSVLCLAFCLVWTRLRWRQRWWWCRRWSAGPRISWKVAWLRSFRHWGGAVTR